MYSKNVSWWLVVDSDVSCSWLYREMRQPSVVGKASIGTGTDAGSSMDSCDGAWS